MRNSPFLLGAYPGFQGSFEVGSRDCLKQRTYKKKQQVGGFLGNFPLMNISDDFSWRWFFLGVSYVWIHMNHMPFSMF